MTKKAMTVKRVVVHENPDIEALASIWILRRFGTGRRYHLADELKYKFIPSGKLMHKDWPDEPDLDPARLEEQGFLFIDCGGGHLDHHGSDDNRSTIERLAEETDLYDNLGFLRTFVDLIASQDKSGKGVARDSGYKKSSTPHTPRTLRNVISGWNLLYQDQPEKVVHLAFTAFDGVLWMISEEGEKRLGPGGEGEVEIPVRSNGYFLLLKVCRGVSEQFGGPDGDREMVEEFIGESRKALERMEEEWVQAEKDFSDALVVSCKGPVQHRDGRSWERTNVNLVAGKSQSVRFGAYARYRTKNRGTEHVVVLQHWTEDKFNISTTGMILDDVAAALGAADACYRGARLHGPQIEALARPGDLYYYQGARKLNTFHYPEFRTVFGNEFMTNHRLPPTKIHRPKVVSIVIQILKGLPLDTNQECPCVSKGYCKRYCKWSDYELAGCRRFREEKRRRQKR